MSTSPSGISPHPEMNYKAFDPNSIGDPFFLLTSDFITVQMPKYLGATITLSESSAQNSFVFYHLRYKLADGNEWEIYANINIQTFVITIER